jgi:MinD-like ATPase involved in chromosome partitioning or flagellar assembly
MMQVCWSIKGGSGTTVVASSLALVTTQSRRISTSERESGAVRDNDVLLVDLGGDCGRALGMRDIPLQGVVDWLHSPQSVDSSALDRLRVSAPNGLSLLASGNGELFDVEPQRWRELISYVRRQHQTVIDLGMNCPLEVRQMFLAAADQSLLVVRNCYLALQNPSIVDASQRIENDVIFVREDGRAHSKKDVEVATQSRVIAEIRVDPLIARSVDAGLLYSNLPRALTRPITTLVAGSVHQRHVA